MTRVAKSLRDLVSKSEVSISKIVLSGSEDLVCRNMFCDKVTQPCLCRLEHAVSYVDLSKVTHLDLSNNRLTELPPSLEKMTNLEYLDLRDNKLEYLPKVIKEFENLKHISISGNNFERDINTEKLEHDELEMMKSWLFK